MRAAAGESLARAFLEAGTPSAARGHLRFPAAGSPEACGPDGSEGGPNEGAEADRSPGHDAAAAALVEVAAAAAPAALPVVLTPAPEPAEAIGEPDSAQAL